MYTTAYTKDTHSTCFLLNDNSEHYVIDGQELTSDYIWTLNQEEREALIEKVIDYQYSQGFPYKELLTKCYDDTYIMEQLIKLAKYKSSKVLTSEGFISNSGSLCLDVCRFMNKDMFWKAKGDTNSRSTEEVFYNRELLREVLKNRMGWCLTTERGYEEPYIFDIGPAMIIQGIRSSRTGYTVSNFRPTIAKFIYEKYVPVGGSVFDYSCGWGARMLAATSLGLEYYGTDPLTTNNIQNFVNKYLPHSKVTLIKSGSEKSEAYTNIPKVDMCMSCPPYFTLERYSDDATQCYVENANYNTWLQEYWKSTVDNCLSILKDDGHFVLIIKDSYGKMNLKDDMCKIIEEQGLKLIDTYQYKTTRDHLTGKRKTGVVSKNSEYILVYKKC